VTKNTVKTLQQPLIGLFELYLVKYALTFDCESKSIKYLYLNHSRFLPRFVFFMYSTFEYSMDTIYL